MSPTERVWRCFRVSSWSTTYKLHLLIMSFFSFFINKTNTYYEYVRMYEKKRKQINLHKFVVDVWSVWSVWALGFTLSPIWRQYISCLSYDLNIYSYDIMVLKTKNEPWYLTLFLHWFVQPECTGGLYVYKLDLIACRGGRFTCRRGHIYQAQNRPSELVASGLIAAAAAAAAQLFCPLLPGTLCTNPHPAHSITPSHHHRRDEAFVRAIFGVQLEERKQDLKPTQSGSQCLQEEKEGGVQLRWVYPRCTYLLLAVRSLLDEIYTRVISFRVLCVRACLPALLGVSSVQHRRTVS